MISMIAALANNRAIGKDNRLLWKLPADLRHFRQTTLGKPVIMGRKTWESLPVAFRPLPGRRNIVISRNPAYHAPGASLAGSLDEALQQVADAAEAVVIGGAEMYRLALPAADRLYLTEVDESPGGDVFFPELSPDDWREVAREMHVNSHVNSQANPSGPDFSFVVYDRR